MYAFCFAVLIVLPIFTAAEGGAQLTSEIADGTLQLLLARPLSRSRIFATKLVTAVIYMVILTGAFLAVTLLVGLVAVGWGDLRIYPGVLQMTARPQYLTQEQALYAFALAGVFAAGGYGMQRLEAGGYQSGTLHPDDLRIVSWNVGGAGGYGGRSLKNEFLPHIAAVPRKLNADLILLQEVASSHQAHRLGRMLGVRGDVIVAGCGSGLTVALGQRGRLQSHPGLTRSSRSLAATYQSPGRPLEGTAGGRYGSRSGCG